MGNIYLCFFSRPIAMPLLDSMFLIFLSNVGHAVKIEKKTKTIKCNEKSVQYYFTFFFPLFSLLNIYVHALPIRCLHFFLQIKQKVSPSYHSERKEKKDMNGCCDKILSAFSFVSAKLKLPLFKL